MVTSGLSRITDRGVTVVVAHHVSKGNFNVAGKSPLGSQVLNLWFRHKLRLEKRSSTRRKLFVEADNAEDMILDLDFDVTDDAVTFEVVNVERDDSRHRSKETLDNNRKIHDWILENARSDKNRSEVARRIASEFPDLSAGTYRNRLRDGAYGVALKDGQWVSTW